jgi:alpha-L-arabinofuranosidase
VDGGEATVLTAERLQDYNDFGGKNKVIPQAKSIEPNRDGTLNYRAPRHSVSSLVLKLK